MSIISAILLGIVQGLTEFLPVSSSGHLVIVRSLFNIDTGGGGVLFEAVLHLGTLVSVVIAYREDVAGLIIGFFSMLADLVKGRGLSGDPDVKGKMGTTLPPYRNFIVAAIISTLPLFAIILVKDRIEAAFENPGLVAAMLLVTGTMLLLSDRIPAGRRGMERVNVRNAVSVGIAQAIAVIPGISRSGATITAGLACGFKREFAAKYAFIISIPAILGANILSFIDAVKDTADLLAPGYYIIGALAAAVSGYFAIGLIRLVITNRRFKYFGYYCFVAGIFTLGYLFFSG